jgi:hypothetical protein
MASHHPPPDTCFREVWYNATDDIASVLFWYGTSGQQQFVPPNGWYWCRANMFDSPFDFSQRGVDHGLEFNSNYRQGAIAVPGTITRETGVYPGSVQNYP